MARRLTTILAADVVGYSRLMEADEKGTFARLTELRKKTFSPAVSKHGGRIVKLMGDGALVEFASVLDAVNCALDIQKTLAQADFACAGPEPLCLRIGINLGDVIASDGDIYGDGVNIAARLEQIAEPGGVCLSSWTYEQVRGKLDAEFEDLGAQQVKNLNRPIGVWMWRGKSQSPDSLRPPAGEDDTALTDAGPSEANRKASIAVLPFTNMSSDAELEYLADGLTEDLITLLARVPGFIVIARNSSFAFKGQSVDARQVGTSLNVRYMIEGSLRPVGKKLRVTVQLIETSDGRHIWADRFDCAADAEMEIQDRVTQNIIARLEPALARAEIRHIRRQPRSNPDAWDLYREANSLLSLKGWHRDTFEEALGLLSRAVEMEPDFAQAHAYYSLLTALGHLFDLSPDGEGEGDSAEARAIESAEKAMELEPYDSAVLGFAGCALSDIGHVARGIGILQRAVEADPSNAQAWVALGAAQIRAGKARKGVELLRHGMRLSPLDNRLSYWGTNLAYALFRLHHKEEALEEARLACRRDDKNYMARAVLAMIAFSLSREGEARDAVADALRIRPDLKASDLSALLGRRGTKLLVEKELLPA
ncbi:MAG: adenylate/guanylate cyclase domain-containing protein [Rhodovibrionaceae bacterium]|nr:adenylate/guanylate cyclase domain-containing protein [Rhodovibrionaceae bacterium]